MNTSVNFHGFIDLYLDGDNQVRDGGNTATGLTTPMQHSGGGFETIAGESLPDTTQADGFK